RRARLYYLWLVVGRTVVGRLNLASIGLDLDAGVIATGGVSVVRIVTRGVVARIVNRRVAGRRQCRGSTSRPHQDVHVRASTGVPNGEHGECQPDQLAAHLR